MIFNYVIGALLSSFLLLSSTLTAFTFPQNAVANVAVGDLRSAPLVEGVDPMTSELLSQALYGEPFVVQEQNGSWYRVDVTQQAVYDEKAGWRPLGAWIRAEQTLVVEKQLQPNLVVTASNAHIFTAMEDASGDSSFFINASMGTELYGKKELLGVWEVILADGVVGYIRNANVATLESVADMTVADLRKSLGKMAEKMVNDPILVGGRSGRNSAHDGQPTGVDDAGFINLLFRAHGYHLPRSVGDLYTGSSKLANKPQKGDLVFLANNTNPSAINHVMMVIEDDKLVEVSSDTASVRTVSSSHRLSAPLSTWNSGDNNGQYIIYFGTYINRPE